MFAFSYIHSLFFLKKKHLGQQLREGDWIALDGTSGTVYAGRVRTVPSDVLTHFLDGDDTDEKGEVPLDVEIFRDIMQWSDEFRR